MLVLVTYASRHGSTREIAERIAARLGERGSTVEIRPVDKVRGVGVYDAVVLGSAVYNGSWVPEATAFVRRNRFVLDERPVWLFSAGAFGDRHGLIGSLMKKEPREIGAFREAIRVRS